MRRGVIVCAESRPVLHAFVAADDGPEGWGWQEIPLTVPDEQAWQKAGFRGLVVVDRPVNSHVAATNALWERIRKELEESRPPKFGVD